MTQHVNAQGAVEHCCMGSFYDVGCTPDCKTNSRPHSGFEDIPIREICRDRGHAAPNMLVVPNGKRYRHVCPACGAVQYLYQRGVTL